MLLHRISKESEVNILFLGISEGLLALVVLALLEPKTGLSLKIISHSDRFGLFKIVGLGIGCFGASLRVDVKRLIALDAGFLGLPDLAVPLK